MLQATRISIRNILGIEALEFQPGPVTRVTGGNAAGKTSVIEAIKAVLQGGHDVTLLRKGQEKGEVGIEFADGTEISMRVTPKGTYRDVKRDGQPLKQPASKLKALWDALAANPIDFVEGKPQQRIDWLLEGIDPGPVREELQASFPEITRDMAQLDQLGALAAIDAVDNAVRAMRADFNRDAKTARTTVEQLSIDLPEAQPGIEKAIAKGRADLEAVRLKEQTAIEAQRAKVSAAKQAHEEAQKAERAAIFAKIEELQGQIAMLRLEASNLETGLADQKAELDRSFETWRAEVAAEAEAERKPIEATLAALEEKRRASIAAEERRRTIAELTDRGSAAQAASDRCTDQLADLEDMRKRLAEDLPIAGLEIRDGEIFQDGVPFDRLNEAQRWSIAIGVARKRAGEIGIVCADGFELLDDKNFAAFVAMAKKSDLHFIVTDRGNGPLAIDTEGVR